MIVLVSASDSLHAIFEICIILKKISYHHVQIILVHPVIGVQPALVALIRLRLYHFDSICIDVPIGVVPVWTADGFIKQTLKHRFRNIRYLIFQRGIHGRVCIYGDHIQTKINLMNFWKVCYISLTNSISKSVKLKSLFPRLRNWIDQKRTNIYFKSLIIWPEMHIMTI